MTEPRSHASNGVPLRSLPLERKLPLLVLAMFAVVLAVSLAVSYVEIRRAAIESAGERLSSLGQSFGSMIEQQTNNRLTALRRVARDTAVQAALHTPNAAPTPGVMRALLPLMTNPADTATPPELFTAAGEPIGRARLETPTDQRQLHDELQTLAASNDTGHVTRVRVTNGGASYWLAVPVRTPDGNLLGFMAQERHINVNARTLPLLRGLIGSDIEYFFRNADDNTWVKLSGGSTSPPTKSESALDSLAVFTHGTAGPMLAANAPCTTRRS